MIAVFSGMKRRWYGPGYRTRIHGVAVIGAGSMCVALMPVLVDLGVVVGPRFVVMDGGVGQAPIGVAVHLR